MQRFSGPAALAAALLWAGCAPRAGVRPAAAAPDEAAAPAGEPFAGAATLDREALVAAVLARNGDVAAAREAVRAAQARHPQVTALDDPMLTYSLAPGSAVPGGAPFGQTVRVAQRLPFPGKRDRAGDMALAEAEMARGDLAAARLRLALIASSLFAEHYATARALAITDDHLALLEELKHAAEIQYAAGRAGAQDPLMAEVEAGMLARRRLALEAQRAAQVAEINALLHRSSEAPLPPPPDALAVGDAPAQDASALLAIAVERRPELQSMRAGVEAETARVALAERAYAPDFELMAEYSSMWEMPAHRWMAGVSLNVPLQLGARDAALDEADARRARARHQAERMEHEVRAEVQRALAQLTEAYGALALFEQRILPAAKAQVEAARIGFVSGGTPFVAVVGAERGLRDVQLEVEMARAAVLTRRAALERAVGAPLAEWEGGAR